MKKKIESKPFRFFIYLPWIFEVTVQVLHCELATCRSKARIIISV